MTLLGPLIFAAMFVIPVLLTSIEDKDERQIAIIDHTGLYYEKINDTDLLKFHYLAEEEEFELKRDFKSKGYYAFLLIEDNLLIRPEAISLYSDKQITIEIKEHISRSLRDFLRSEKLLSYEMEGLSTIISEIEALRVSIPTIRLGDDGKEKHTSTEFAMVISMIFAFMTYMFVFIYGSQVLRGVMEEKTNRIVEVIISSVKPFQLMLGKIGGIALVALTQFFLWVVLTLIIITALQSFVFSDPAVSTGIENVAAINGQVDMEMLGGSDLNIIKIKEIVSSMNPLKTLSLFLFYFIGGYLLYAALFAAIGSAIDNETDSQQFMLPVTIPIILALWVAMVAFRNPHSSLVFWFSMIPLTSPVVMMARMPFDVPGWEIILSMVLLILGFLFTTWFSARIYRTGILIYGKKISYKELWKWFRYAGR